MVGVCLWRRRRRGRSTSWRGWSSTAWRGRRTTSWRGRRSTSWRRSGWRDSENLEKFGEQGEDVRPLSPLIIISKLKYFRVGCADIKKIMEFIQKSADLQ
jgi:hypothetical protein